VEATITLQQGLAGYSGCQDTYLYQWAPNANYCWQESLKVGHKQQYAALLRFDTSPIPAGATILDACLEMYATGWGGSDITLDAFRVLRPWQHCQATWNQAQSGSPWAQPGCNDTATDRAGSPEGSVTTSSIRSWYAFDLTGLVQGWVDGSMPNNGLLLRGALPWSTGIFYFASAANGSSSLRPKLVVHYRISGGAGIGWPGVGRQTTGQGHPRAVALRHLRVRP
jgi:hypothetical protein